jgi:hypothetical protein
VASAGARLVWHLDRIYRPETAPHVWIEHGHQNDPLNRFFLETMNPPVEYWGSARPPILPDRAGTPRLLECVGTRFLIRFLNELDLRYPFVDNIKPFSKFLSIFASSARRLSGGSARAALSVFALGRFAAAEAIVAPSNLLSVTALDDALGPGLIALDEASGGGFTAALRGAGCDFGGRSLERAASAPEGAIALLDFALSHLEVLDAVCLDSSSMLGIEDGDNGMLSLGTGMKLDETRLLRDAAAMALGATDVRFVVMGHTHEPVDDPFYKNTGSWTRYWQMEPGETPTWKEMLTRAAHLPMSLRHAVVHDDGPRTVTLELFQPPP